MTTHSTTFKPYWYITPSSRAIVNGMMLCLIPILLLLAYEKNVSALAVIFTGAFSALGAEVLANKLNARKLYSGLTNAALQGIVAGMLFPQNYPVYSVFFITSGVFFVSRHAFGGTAGTWINTAALAAAVAFFTGSSFFPAPFDMAEYFGIRIPSRLFLQGIEGLSKDAPIIDFFNDHFFRFFGASVPDGYVSLLCDSRSPITAFRFNLLILLASLFLISLNMIHRVIPLCYLAVYLGLVYFFGGMGTGFATGDVLFAALTGGTFFTAFFLLGWFGTTPLSHNGKIAYGILSGVAAFFISGPGISPSGAALTVLAANIVSICIQYVERARSKAGLYKKLYPKIRAIAEEAER
jgi:electron transport complex protein RnfD